MPEDIGVMNREGESTFTQPPRSVDSPGHPDGVVLGAGLVGVSHARGHALGHLRGEDHRAAVVERPDEVAVLDTARRRRPCWLRRMIQ